MPPTPCATCVRERARKTRTATSRCGDCLDPVCKHHAFHSDGVVLCKECDRLKRRRLSDELAARPALIGEELVAVETTFGSTDPHWARRTGGRAGTWDRRK